MRWNSILSKLLTAVALSSLALSAVAAETTKKQASGKHHVRKVAAHAGTKAAASKRGVRPVAVRQAVVPAAALAAAASEGPHSPGDPVPLRSSVALVMDQDTHEVLLAKNPQTVQPIASITKLMTALVVTEAAQPLDDVLQITQDDIDTEKGTHSRLTPGTHLTRGEMLHLALMSSENRAANALGRNYPGGLPAAVAAMNAKAKALGMNDTHYVEPTGLSSQNQSSAHDLAILVNAAHQVPLLREFSTTPGLAVAVGRKQLQFHTTNRLVMSSSWDIGVQKTGFINEAGQCLVMQAKLAGRKLIMVFLDSAGKYSRIADAERIRKWLVQTQGQGGEAESGAAPARRTVRHPAAG